MLPFLFLQCGYFPSCTINSYTVFYIFSCLWAFYYKNSKMKEEMSLTAILAFVPVNSGPNMTAMSIPNYLILDDNLMLIAGCFLSSFFSPQAWTKFEADSIYIIGTKCQRYCWASKDHENKSFLCPSRLAGEFVQLIGHQLCLKSWEAQDKHLETMWDFLVALEAWEAVWWDGVSHK